MTLGYLTVGAVPKIQISMIISELNLYNQCY